MSDSPLTRFVRESNRVEGIHRDPTDVEVDAHIRLLNEDLLTVVMLEDFVGRVAGKPLRDQVGMDVRVGKHLPPSGGLEVREHLERLVDRVNRADITPYEAHVVYELLHPFMDGNGRSGRALWLWHMDREWEEPFALSFLHRFYYQTLDASRS